MQGHDVALEKLPSKVAAVVPREQLAQALSAAGLSAKGARFVNFAELAAIEALQVPQLLPRYCVGPYCRGRQIDQHLDGVRHCSCPAAGN